MVVQKNDTNAEMFAETTFWSAVTSYRFCFLFCAHPKAATGRRTPKLSVEKMRQWINNLQKRFHEGERVKEHYKNGTTKTAAEIKDCRLQKSVQK